MQACTRFPFFALLILCVVVVCVGFFNMVGMEAAVPEAVEDLLEVEIVVDIETSESILFGVGRELLEPLAPNNSTAAGAEFCGGER